MSLFAVLVAHLGMPAVIGIISTVVFLIVYLIRKVFGKQWDKAASYIPALNFNLTPGYSLLSKFAQSVPAILLAAGIGALTSGVSLGPTLISALAGPLAVLGHEMLKAFPFVPYKGATPESKDDLNIPGPPNLPTGLTFPTSKTTIVLAALCVSLMNCLPSSQVKVCSAADKAAIEAQYIENVAIKCAAYNSFDECPAAPDLAAQRAKDEIPCR